MSRSSILPPSSNQPARIHRIQIDGEPVVTMDFSQASSGQALAMLDELPGIFEGQALGSVRILTDLTGVSYDSSVTQKWKAALVKFDPYVRASAVYGASGLSSVAIFSFIDLMHWLKIPNAAKKIRSFKDRDKALAWLLQG